MKIFITGGSGFIGKYVVRELEKSHELLVLSRKKHKDYRFVQGDMENVDKWIGSVEGFSPDAAVHLAWEGVADKDYKLDLSIKNLTSSVQIFRLLAEVECKKVLSMGSRWEYQSNRWPAKESDVPRPVNHLGGAKTALYYMGRGIAQEYSAQLIWPRLFTAYGPGQSEKYLIPHLVKSHLSGEEPNIKNPSGGGDFVYVEDVARAVRLLLEADMQGDVSSIYNVGSGQFVSVGQINALVQEIVEGENPSDIVYESNGPHADASKIKSDIGWVPQVGLEEGVKKIIKSYEK